MAPTDRPDVRVTNPTDLLALVPYLLGYHPTSSLIVLALNGRTVLLTARLDLPMATGDAQQWHAALDTVVATMASHRATAAILAGYGSAEQVALAVDAATAGLTAASIPVTEVLRVADGRCYSPAAAATAAGLVALPDRDALTAELAPVTGPARDAMVAATITAARFLLELADAAAPQAGADPDTSPDTPLGRALLDAGQQYLAFAQRTYRAGRRLDDEQAALLTVLLELPAMGDLVARRTTGQRWQIAMWTDLLRRAEPDFTTVPATLLALAAIQAGDGARAAIAAQRALDADPANRLAQLLAQALAAGIDPGTITTLLHG